MNKIAIDNESFKELSRVLVEDSAKVLIEHYSQEKKCLEQLKENLTKVFELVGAKEKQPFIIFIDEIDRCRPTYAIEMLENIKHLFGIPHLVFVISIDKVQLSQSIQAIYGQIDTENYLRRFFDLEFILPNPSPQRFCEYLQEQLGIQTNLAHIFIADNFTLRELQKILPQIKLLEIQQLQDNNQESIFDIRHAIFILLVKIYRPDLYFQLPNITDAEGIMGIVEKLVCKEKEPLNENLFVEYVNLIYSLCNKIYQQDRTFFEPSFPTQDNMTRKWFKIRGTNIIHIDLNEYSYIVQTYCNFFVGKRRQWNLRQIDTNKIITAINFTSQFDIQDRQINNAVIKD
ncbi:P-loop NTPase fold protein [Helicobacter sp. MIT 21-1697]|nr:P-loop NTPase fold protein [Helicobacter sp. MIT 21-1697]